MNYKVFQPENLENRENSFSEKYSSLKRYFGREDLTPLWIADMEFSSPDIITDAIEARVKHPIYGYTTIDPDVIEAISYWTKMEHDLIIDKQGIFLSPTIITSLASAIEAFSSEGNEIALFSPAYGPFFWTIDRLNRSTCDIPLLFKDNFYEINFNLFEKRAENGNIKLLIFCSPHNPGGRVWRTEELEMVVEICKKYNIIIFSDEIHSDIVYKPNKHIPILSIRGASDISVIAHSIGKTFNCSGLRTSFILAPERKLRISILKGLQKANNDNVNMFGQAATKAAFTEKGSLYKAELTHYLNESRDMVCKIIAQSGSLTPVIPEGTFLVWTDFRSIGLSEKEIRKKIINDAKVALNHGTFFGESGRGFFRINIAHPRVELLNAVNRLVEIF